jgi:hypothetical protein
MISEAAKGARIIVWAIGSAWEKFAGLHGFEDTHSAITGVLCAGGIKRHEFVPQLHCVGVNDGQERWSQEVHVELIE